MNIRLFSLALLVSAIPSISTADISWRKEDFVAVEKVSPEGEPTVNVKLSKSGKAKLKKLVQQRD